MMESEADEGGPEVKQFTENMAAMLQGGVEKVAHYFVCCFSRTGDDLGQWRAYADNGRGYALGFDGSTLEQAFTRVGTTPISGPMTFPVTYGDDQLREMQRQIISKVIPLLSAPYGRDLPNGAINKYMSELSVSLSVPTPAICAFFQAQGIYSWQDYRFLYLCGLGSCLI